MYTARIRHGALSVVVYDFVRPNGLCFFTRRTPTVRVDSVFHGGPVIRMFDVDGYGCNGRVFAEIFA